MEMFSLRTGEPSLKCKPQGASTPVSLSLGDFIPGAWLQVVTTYLPFILFSLVDFSLKGPFLPQLWDACRSYRIGGAPSPHCSSPLLSLAIVFLNKTSPRLCPNLFLFGKGYGRLAYFTLGTSSKVMIVLNMCITALLDTQGNANWKGAPSLGKLAKRGSVESKPVSPKSPFCVALSHHPLCVRMCLGSRAMWIFFLFGDRSRKTDPFLSCPPINCLQYLYIYAKYLNGPWCLFSLFVFN